MGKWIQTVDYKVKRKDVVLSVGDYIDYHDHAGENGKKLYKGRWQVLGSDDMGNLLIVSEKNVAPHYFNVENTLEGAMEAYSTGVDTLNKMCEVYAKGPAAVSARSIRIEDVDRLTRYDKTKNDEYGKSYTLKNKKTNTFIWHDGTKWHKARPNRNITLTRTYYFYKASKLQENKKVYDMLFGKDDKCYWLASSYVCANVGTNFSYGSFGLRFVHNGYLIGNGFFNLNGCFNNMLYAGVRVVVSLNSDIKITPKQGVVNEWKIQHK